MKYRGTITVTFEALKDMLNLDDSVEIISVGTSDDEAKRDIFHINLSSKEATQLTERMCRRLQILSYDAYLKGWC